MNSSITSATEATSKLANSQEFEGIFNNNRGIQQNSQVSQKSNLSFPKKSELSLNASLKNDQSQLQNTSQMGKSQNTNKSQLSQPNKSQLSQQNQSQLAQSNKSINDSQLSWKTYVSTTENEKSQQLNISQSKSKSQLPDASHLSQKKSIKNQSNQSLFDQSINISTNYYSKKQKSVMSSFLTNESKVSQISSLSIPKKTLLNPAVISPIQAPNIPKNPPMPPHSHQIAASTANLNMYNNSMSCKIPKANSQCFNDKKLISDISEMNETSLLSSSNISTTSTIQKSEKTLNSGLSQNSSIFQQPKRFISASTRQIENLSNIQTQPFQSCARLPTKQTSSLAMQLQCIEDSANSIHSGQRSQLPQSKLNDSMQSTLQQSLTQNQISDIKNIINDTKLKIEQLENQHRINIEMQKEDEKLPQAIQLLQVQIVRLEKLLNPQNKRQLIFNALFKIGNQLLQ